jgi:hypothetical protein
LPRVALNQVYAWKIVIDNFHDCYLSELRARQTLFLHSLFFALFLVAVNENDNSEELVLAAEGEEQGIHIKFNLLTFDTEQRLFERV